MAETATAIPADVPVKPALKHDRKSRKNRPASLKWDEAKIEEHDKLRGTRMKIDEPNTPYHQYDSGSETDGSQSANRKAEILDMNHLNNKLEAHAAVKLAYPSSPSSHGGEEALNEDDEDGGADGGKADLKELEFKEHRKRHYNEMELVRKFRQEHPDGLVDDEEDDEDNDADDEDDNSK